MAGTARGWRSHAGTRSFSRPSLRRRDHWGNRHRFCMRGIIVIMVTPHRNRPRRREVSMDWQEHYRSRTVTPAEAVAKVQSNQTVAIPIFPPATLLPALWERRSDLRNVTLRLLAPSTDPGWLQPEAGDHFTIEYEVYIGDFGRPAMDDRRATFVPNLFSLGFKMWDERPEYRNKADVAILTVSLPNQHGY